MRIFRVMLAALTTCAGSGSPAATSACPAQDAYTDGTDCLETIGYVWDGHQCAPIVCGCLGADCAAMTPTRAACEERHARCF